MTLTTKQKERLRFLASKDSFLHPQFKAAIEAALAVIEGKGQR